MPNPITDAISSLSHLADEPDFHRLSLADQRYLCAEYIRTYPEDASEITAYLADGENENLADLVSGGASDDAKFDLENAFVNAAISAYSGAIQNEIDEHFDATVAEHGHRVPASIHGPEERLPSMAVRQAW